MGLYATNQSELKQDSVLFESALANEISLVDTYKKTSSKCCVDPLNPPRLSCELLPNTLSPGISNYSCRGAGRPVVLSVCL